MNNTNDYITKFILKHEEFKSKGIKLTEDDLFSWNMLLEDMKVYRTQLKSELQEYNLKLKNDKGERKILLKEIKDDKGKKIHTEGTADAVIDKEFQEKDIEYLILKNTIDKIEDRISVIPEYINIVKLSMR